MFGPAVLEPHLGREGTGRKCKRGDTCSRCEAAQGRKLGLTPLPPALDPIIGRRSRDLDQGWPRGQAGRGLDTQGQGRFQVSKAQR